MGDQDQGAGQRQKLVRHAGDREIDRDVKLVRRQLAGQLLLALPVHNPLPLMRVIGEVEQDDLVEYPQAARQTLVGRRDEAGDPRVRQDLAQPQQRRDGYDHVAQLIRPNDSDILDLAGEGICRGAMDNAPPGIDLLNHGQRGFLVERRDDAVAIHEYIGRRRLRYDDALTAPIDPLPGVAASIDGSEHQFVRPQGEIRKINPGVVDVFLDIRIGFFPPLRRNDKVALVYKLSIKEDFDIQIGRRGHNIPAQRIAKSLPDAPLRSLVNAVPGENERVLVTDMQFVTRPRVQIGIYAAIEFVKFLLRQPANPIKSSLLKPKLDARS